MRDILFRGKRDEDEKWVFGSYITEPWGSCIQVIENDTPNTFKRTKYSVHKETVGQYTGLEDKNGRKIFEGDILEFEDCGEEGYEYKEAFYFKNRAAVCWENGRWQLTDFISTDSGVVDDMNDSHEDFISLFYDAEVIGNIYDHPELMGGAEE